MRIRAGGADVAGAIVAIGGHEDIEIGPHLPRGKLILDEQFAGKVEHPGAPHLQAGDVDRVRLPSARGKRKRVDRSKRPPVGLPSHLLGEFFNVQPFPGCKRHRHASPADVGGRQRLLVARGHLEGAPHAGGEPGGEDDPVGGGGVVVFAGGDVAAGAGEVEVEGAGEILRAKEAGDAGEVGAGNTGAVVAHRMGGVARDRGKRVVAREEDERGQIGVDRPLGPALDRHILRGAAAPGDERPVGADEAAVAGNLRHLGPAEAGMRDRLRFGKRVLDRRRRSCDHLAMKVAVEAGMIFDPHVSEELFGSEVGMGGVVLVEGVDGNS